ncbi:MAG: ABC transporter ATP-binding protein [Reichenbachiella sp.]|uniref:ABC transporter ATP-binding protein n=1 Tax=Reichenbachiella sp. TaxID=2184521 RepID=UPI0029674F01|nr:ABC transporter ATP-binding protein [Reichenbachiella sp.]MDW3209130.1 ABC transporter ATP-binding protein [Reichenbachiella sp.]
MIAFNLNKKFYSSHKEVDIRVNAQLEEGKITAIYGKSGAGKTSVLRMLAGLLKPDKGMITVGNDSWYDHKKNHQTKPNKRNIGMVFQDYALFPNMSVLKNIQYGLNSDRNEELVNRIIEISDLGNLLNRMPSQLSGGQQQRVALARAIVRKPRLLLLDEPLSALDTSMRTKLQEEILAMQNLIQTTIVLVSHHLPEVFKLADHVLVMDEGQLIQQGTPSEVFMNDGETQLTGELISSKKEGDQTILKLMVEGKVVSVQLPK